MHHITTYHPTPLQLSKPTNPSHNRRPLETDSPRVSQDYWTRGEQAYSTFNRRERMTVQPLIFESTTHTAVVLQLAPGSSADFIERLKLEQNKEQPELQSTIYRHTFLCYRPISSIVQRSRFTSIQYHIKIVTW